MLLGCRVWLLSQICPLSLLQNEPLSVCSLLHELLRLCACSLSVFGSLLTEDLLVLGCIQSHINGEGVLRAGAVQQCFKVGVSGGVLREAPKAGAVDRPDRCQPRTQSPLFVIVSHVTCLVYW